MSGVTGYILILNRNRHNLLNESRDHKFVEPVSEFDHSRNIPLVCFIVDESGNITHIGLGARGMRAGTSLRKLNIEEIFKLNEPVSAWKIAELSGSNVRYYLMDQVKKGGLLTPKSFEKFLEILIEEAPETAPIVGKFSEARRLRIERLSEPAKKSLAEQKEAILTALNIAGIDRDNVLNWDYKEKEEPLSYLDGISHITLREDSIITNDLSNIPGFDLIKSTPHSASVFRNDKTCLTVLLANRLPLEELLGTDLIYFNEDFKCFVMVQYKVMEKERDIKKEKDIFKFRLPNQQFTKEISRMEAIYSTIKNTTGNETVNDYRISENPFFIKICPRLNFNPDNVGLSIGMYLPLDYIKMLENDKCIEGKQGGKGITYDNVGRYFDNTGFKTIIEGGWIGTNPNQSQLIEKIIRDILENGKAAVVAIKQNIKAQKPTSNSQ